MSQESGPGGVAPGTVTASTRDPVQAQGVWGHICLIKKFGLYSMQWRPLGRVLRDKMTFFREELQKVWKVISEGDHAAGAKPQGVDMEGIRQDVLFWKCGEVAMGREGNLGAGRAHEVGFYSVTVGL